MFNPIRKQLRTTCHLAAVVLTVAFTAALATACQQDQLTDEQGNALNPDGTVTITRLLVGIGEGDAAAASRAADAAATASRAATRAAEPFDPSRPNGQGYDTGVKTEFVDGDRLHFMVFLTQDEAAAHTPQFSTATLRGGTWTLKPAIRLPQNAADAYSIQIFYDGKSTEYDSSVMNKRDESDTWDAPEGFYLSGNFYKANLEMTRPVNTGVTPWPDHNLDLTETKKDANGNAYFHDALWCEGGTSASTDFNSFSTLTIGSGGTLSITMAHANSLLRITKVTNELGSDVARAEVITAAYKDGKTYAFTLWGKGEVAGNPIPSSATPGATNPSTTDPWQAVIGQGIYPYFPKYIRITLTDGRTYKIALPNVNGSTIDPNNLTKGLNIQRNCVYAYRLTLRYGALTAESVSTPGALTWNTQNDPAVPKNYIAIRTRAELEAIAANMTGSYILMNDIDLTPATPAELWTPLGSNVPGATPGTITPFRGRFNGNGHTLRGLTIKDDNKQSLGLFAELNSATIYNLHFSEANVTCTTTPPNDSERGIGTLAGYALNSTISLCTTTACTLAYNGEAAQKPIAIGSLVGISDATTFTQCHATRCIVTDATTNPAAAAANANSAGGLVGLNTNGSRLVSCYTRSCTVNATACTYAGGLMGSNNKSILIYGCYAASPTLSGGKAAGALVGLNFGNVFNTGLIASCYATLAPGSTAPRLVGFNGDPTSSGSNADGTVNDRDNAKIIACISPLTLRSQEQPTADKPNVVSLTPRGTPRGYLPLNDATELAALADKTGADFAALFGFTTDGTGISGISTVLVNTTSGEIQEDFGAKIPPRGIYVKKTDYTAAGIWSDLKDDNKVIPPLIKW